MTSRNTGGTNASPQLVVKIIGSKLIRYYTEEPEKEKAANIDASQESSNRQQNIESKAMKSPQDKEDFTSQAKSMADREESSPWPALTQVQVPHRLCVTAPPEYNTQLRINHKKTPTLRSAPHTALRLHSCQHSSHPPLIEEGPFHQQEEKDLDHLFAIVYEEVKEWRKDALKNIETELRELDSSCCGTIDHSHLTEVFFRNEVPLKLPTLRLLLNTFSNSASPDKVHYKELLSLIYDAVVNEEQPKNTEQEVGDVQRTFEVGSVPGSTKSEHLADLSSETGVWLQRFHKMSEAMWICDTKNTGFIDKDKARRLIQNYNLIFNLNLTPMKIDEAIRTSRSESGLHLDTLLQILKDI